MYKPSKFSEAPMDLGTDAYGASQLAPTALGIGATVEDFTLPTAQGVDFSSAAARAHGPTVLIFYRGHW